MSIEKNIAQLIRTTRTQKGVTQDDFATALGVSRVTVSDWEREVKIPDLLTLARMARFTDWRYHLAAEIFDIVLCGGQQVEVSQVDSDCTS